MSLTLSSSRLILNAGKTEFIWIHGTCQQLAKISLSPGQSVMPLDKVRVLGVILNSELTMKDHITRISFYQLRQLSVRLTTATLYCTESLHTS